MIKVEKMLNKVLLPYPEEWVEDKFASSIYIKGIKEIVALPYFVRLELTTGDVTHIFTKVDKGKVSK